MTAPEAALLRVYKSKIFSGNALLSKDEFDDKLEKCHAVLSSLVNGLSEREVHDTLNQTVCKGLKEHEEISYGLLFTILTEPANAAKAYRDLSYLSRDGFNLIINKLLQVISDKFDRLLETPRGQILWLLGEMMKNSVIGLEVVALALLKQIAGGDISLGNTWLAENTLKILQNNRSWLDKNSTVLPVALYTYLRIIEDHEASQFSSLRQLEVDFCISVLREKFVECMGIGRDLIRVLHNNTRIPEFTALWKDILYRPQSLSPQFSGITQIFNTRTSRKILTSRLTQDMENKMTFLALKVRFGQQKRYQDWFYRQYLLAPEAQSLIPDLVRFLCGVIHPPNEVLCSDIIPRWAILGWLYTICQNPVAQANVKLALCYDWLFYSGEKDNIMNIEPAMLLMHNSIKTHPSITYGLLEFICKIVTSYSTEHESLLKHGIKRAFRSILDKRVVGSLSPLLNNHRMDRNMKNLVRETLPEFTGRDKESKGEDSSSSTTPPTSPKTEQPPSLSPSTEGNGDDIEVVGEEPEEPDAEEAVFSDDENDQENSKSKFKPIVREEETSLGKSDDVIGNVDMLELEEFQNIDNTLLRDNILKLKNDSDDTLRCEAMESIISTVDSMKDFDDEMATPICVCLAACLTDDLALPCLPDELTESAIEQSFERPQYILFRSITSLSKHDIDREKLYILLNGIHELNPKIGYHFLYFLKSGVGDTEFFNYEDYISYQKDKTLRTVLVSDLTMCHQYDPKLFLHVITSIFQRFNESAVGCADLIRLLCSAISPQEIQEIVTEISMGKLVIIGENQVESLLVNSLSWDAFEQNCLWQFLVAEETPVEMVVGLLPHLNQEDNPVPLSNLLLQLRHESPTADILKPLLCMSVGSDYDGFLLSTCLFKYWSEEEARELANVIAQILTKSIGQNNKRKQGRASGKNQPSVDQVLTHLDLYRKHFQSPSNKSIFKYESLRYSFQQVKAGVQDAKLKARFQKLLDECLEVSDRVSRKRATERVTRNARRRKPASESDESSEEEDEEGDENDEKSDAEEEEEDDSEEEERSELLPRSPSKKRRRTSRLLELEDD
ncbi:integrator complex subunit 3-like [Rhopilema esculentum]|uniref:integrator complex subunit 3-like n=1 Tax=Rhopilema esculentum TaxID=499914 RepID=UPI0031DDD00C